MIAGLIVVHEIVPTRAAQAHPVSSPGTGIHPRISPEPVVDRARHGAAALSAVSPRASGDVNADGLVNVVDLLRLRDVTVGGDEPATPAEIAGGDMNGDGALDASDVAALESLLLGVSAAPATRTSASSSTGPTFHSVPMTLATFDSNESWSGGTVDQTEFREGNAGRKLTAIANRMQHTSRDQFFDASETPWEMSLWVYTDTPTTIGRLLFMVRSGDGIANDYASWAGSGFHQGWNQLIIPSDAIFKPYYSTNNFSWATARTMVFKLEANGNGTASITLDDFTIEPTSPVDRRPPVVSHINVTHVTATSVTMNWKTQESATGVLNYGLTTAYGTQHPAETSQSFQEIVLNDLAPGTRYHCRIEATDAEGLNGTTGDFVFTTAPALDRVPADPSVQYELGLYGVNKLSDLTGLDGSPFTTVHHYFFSGCNVSLVAAEEFLDQAHANGLKVMMGLGCNPVDDRQSMPPVNSFKNHPAIGSWFLYDEPEGHGISQDYLRSAYQMVKQADPNHDLVIASYGYGSAGFPYTDGFDRVDFVAMPIPFQSVSSVIPKLDLANAVGGPWHYVYQAYQPDIDRWIQCCGGPTRYPSEAETRALAFLGVNHGATGLTTFGHNALHDMAGSEWHWAELQSVTQELRQLKPLLASTVTPQVAASTGATTIDLGVRRYQGLDYIIAVNTDGNPRSGTLSLTGATGTTVRRLEDGQTVPLVAGTVADSWSPHEVHLYAVTPLDADVVSPSLSIVEPLAGALVGRLVTITIDAADDMLMDHVQVYVDGVPVGDPLTVAPYTMIWDASGATEGSHVLSAIAYDASGNDQAAEITISLDNVLPSVTMSAPAGGSLLKGTQITLASAATDDDIVTGVQFEIDGVPIGTEVTAPPYELIWNSTTATDGSHVLRAAARDRAGNVATSAGVSVIVDNAPPTVSVTAPANGAYLKGSSFPVTASAADNHVLTGVQFKVDGANLGARDIASPYSVTWTSPAQGSHAITAVAEDAAGHVTTSAVNQVIVDNTAPLAPAAVRDGPGADAQYTNVKTQLTANWDAVVDPLSGVAYYQMAIGTTAGGTQVKSYTNVGNVTTYTRTGLSLSNSTKYYVSIRAVDRSGNVGAVRSSNGITVDTTAPTVSITAPSSGAIVKGVAVTINANASDARGIAQVQFRVDGVNIGAPDTTAPYSIVWNTKTVSNGNRNLTAVATDVSGNSKTSSTVTVKVRN